MLLALLRAGGRQVVHYVKKTGAAPKCGDCGGKILGVSSKRPSEMKRLPACKRTVARAYGGVRCANCVRNRILRAFIIEEQKIVKKVLQEKLKSAKRTKA